MNLASQEAIALHIGAGLLAAVLPVACRRRGQHPPHDRFQVRESVPLQISRAVHWRRHGRACPGGRQQLGRNRQRHPHTVAIVGCQLHALSACQPRLRAPSIARHAGGRRRQSRCPIWPDRQRTTSDLSDDRLPQHLLVCKPIPHRTLPGPVRQERLQALRYQGWLQRFPGQRIAVEHRK